MYTIMKKEYINPEMDIVDIKMNQQLLAGSENKDLIETPTSPSEADSPEFYF